MGSEMCIRDSFATTMDGRVMYPSQSTVPPAFGYREKQADGACSSQVDARARYKSTMLSDCTDQLLAARSLDFGQGQAGSVRFKSAIPPGVD